MLDIETIYNNHIRNKSKEYRKENPKTNSKYRPSSAGMCARKIYYESIEKTAPTTEHSDTALKIFRLGEIVHKDIQDILEEEFNNG